MPILLNVVRLASELLSLQREKSLRSLIRPARLVLAVLGGFALVGLSQFVMTTQGRVQTARSFHPSLPGQVSLAGTQSYSGTTFCDVVSGDPGSDCDYADLAVEKTVSDNTPQEGDTIVYTITVTNHGPDNATSVKLSDELPAGVNYITHTVSWGTYENGLWVMNRLAEAENTTLIITATVLDDTAGTTIINTASVTADQFDPNGDNNEASVSISPTKHRLYLPLILYSYCSRPVIVTDTFASKSNDWPEGTNDGVTTKYTKDEEYLIATDEPDIYAVRLRRAYITDFEIEVDAHWARRSDDQYTGKRSGAGYGIFFGLHSDDKYFYLYRVNTDRQEYNLQRYSENSDERWKSLTGGWVYTDVINKGSATNRLKVVRRAFEISLYVNDKQLFEDLDDDITSGQVALAVDAYENDLDYGTRNADARFDNYSFDGCLETSPNVDANNVALDFGSSVRSLPKPPD